MTLLVEGFNSLNPENLLDQPKSNLLTSKAQ